MCIVCLCVYAPGYRCLQRLEEGDGYTLGRVTAGYESLQCRFWKLQPSYKSRKCLNCWAITQAPFHLFLCHFPHFLEYF